MSQRLSPLNILPKDIAMANTTNQPPQPRTVQDYIDERPMWPDGTHLHAFPMTTMQKRIWMLAAAGKFFEGFVVFMTGVALALPSMDSSLPLLWAAF
jgi:MFS transporter, putative metabolite transport protein